MPAFVYASALRVADDAFTLAVDVAHKLVAGDDGDDDAPRRIRGRPPEVDIIHRSDIVLSLAGFCNGKAIPSAEMKQSMPSKHMHSFLRANASALGLNAVSNIYVDQDQCKLNLTPSRSYELDAHHPRLHLVAITLTYSFRTRESQGKDFNLFTRRSYLPFITALNLVVEKLATVHFVRRYPIVFGRWRERLLDEVDVFPSLCHSLLSTAERSSNEDFKEAVDRLLKRIARRLRSESHRAAAKLAEHLGVEQGWYHDPRNQEPTRQELLSAALRRMLTRGIRPPPFKIATLAGTHADKDEALDDFVSSTSGGSPSSVAFDAIDWANCVAEDFDALDSEDNIPLLITPNVGDSLDDFADEALYCSEDDYLEEDDDTKNSVPGLRTDLRTSVNDSSPFSDAFNLGPYLGLAPESDLEMSSDWSPTSSQSDSITVGHSPALLSSDTHSHLLQTPPESQWDPFSTCASQYTNDADTSGPFYDALELDFSEPEGATTCRADDDIHAQGSSGLLDDMDEGFDDVCEDATVPLDVVLLDDLGYDRARLSYSPEPTQTRFADFSYGGPPDEIPMLDLDDPDSDSDVCARLYSTRNTEAKIALDDLAKDMQIDDVYWNDEEEFII